MGACEQGWGLGGLTGENLGFRGPRREVMRDCPPTHPACSMERTQTVGLLSSPVHSAWGRVVDTAHYTRLQGPLLWPLSLLSVPSVTERKPLKQTRLTGHSGALASNSDESRSQFVRERIIPHETGANLSGAFARSLLCEHLSLPHLEPRY